MLIDGHVHLHHIDDFASLLNAAWRNAAEHWRERGEQPGTVALMLAEMRSQHLFEQLEQSPRRFSPWLLERPGGEAISLRAMRQDGAAALVVAGRQVVTSERLEVLALACRQEIPDGSPLGATIAEARALDALVVLPWGFGKWTSTRGRLAAEALAQAQPGDIFVGDNGGRAAFGPIPSLLRRARARGVPMLSGSDPLPLPGEHLRVAKLASAVRADLSGPAPAAALVRELRSAGPRIEQFGSGVSVGSFVRNQWTLRRRAGVRS